MKKVLLACLSIIALLSFSSFALADTNTQLNGKYVGSQYQPSGKSIALKKSG
jgi:opacity protein-like surface antigen